MSSHTTRTTRSETIRLVLDHYMKGWSHTADEVVDALEIHFMNVRPAVCKLYKEGLLVRTGTKRKTSVGGDAHVMRYAVETMRTRSRAA